MQLSDFPLKSHDKIRYSDVDRQGHVNNAVFVTYLETARTDLLEQIVPGFWDSAYGIVAARLELDYRAELFWPGIVETGTALASIGRTSMVIEQAMFQEGRLVAQAKTVLVLIDAKTHKPVPVPDDLRAKLMAFVRPSA
ncbi:MULTISPECIES: thioesterase family protein [unclassified Acidocella]|uniref:acyl-CoA thioesterase n=1 Tax=unclassified Acidocella TaxID=2648610 RepID=UPI00028DD0E3|nr:MULTISPECIES: thioesterase family protein [unclassified Acidocella]EKN00665.1 thioesterase superfamily protein [Acidocella sp. MX-AZ02]WBO60178.1 acyl-CoA thioesterase [Acidocella sp. MX-AZ03]